MKFYHVKIGWRYEKRFQGYNIEYDLDETKVKQMILEPINKNRRFFFDSKSIEPSGIESLSIYSTEVPSSDFNPSETWVSKFNMIEKAGSNVTVISQFL